MNYIKVINAFFYSLGREEKIKIIEKSNLSNRERIVLVSRFVEGNSVKDSSDLLKISLDGYNKLQRKTYKKFLVWLNRQAENQNVNINNFVKYGGEEND